MGFIILKKCWANCLVNYCLVNCLVEWKAQCITIRDSPQYSWCGMHLDARATFTFSLFLKWRIGLHKLNKFHWNLTDNEGCGFESKKCPKLTEIGSILVEKDGAQYGPYFYTQAEMRDIVSNAKTLCVTVIHEIEMPGHSESVFKSYSELLISHHCPRGSNLGQIHKQ